MFSHKSVIDLVYVVLTTEPMAIHIMLTAVNHFVLNHSNEQEALTGTVNMTVNFEILDEWYNQHIVHLP